VIAEDGGPMIMCPCAACGALSRCRRFGGQFRDIRRAQREVSNNFFKKGQLMNGSIVVPDVKLVVRTCDALARPAY
jgi:hypothetical protein